MDEMCARCGTCPADPDQKMPVHLIPFFGAGVCFPCGIELAALDAQRADKRGDSNDLP